MHCSLKFRLSLFSLTCLRNLTFLIILHKVTWSNGYLKFEFLRFLSFHSPDSQYNALVSTPAKITNKNPHSVHQFPFISRTVYVASLNFSFVLFIPSRSASNAEKCHRKGKKKCWTTCCSASFSVFFSIFFLLFYVPCIHNHFSSFHNHLLTHIQLTI